MQKHTSLGSINIYTFIWVLIFLGFFIWSSISPFDRTTWYLEVAPGIIGFFILVITYNSFRLTSLIYILILIFSIILFIGGHYTYANVPFFEYLKDICGFERNNYDKVGHFLQGFVPVMIAREIVIRKKVFKSNAWMNFFIISFCLALSAFYELIEWIAAVIMGEDADSFLGSQGFIWDTQTDMALALLGSIVAIIILSKLHDKQLKNLNTNLIT